MKKLLPLLLIFIGFSLNAQVGIGTDMPNPSSQLEIVANDRGVLIPQVPLTSSTDETTISNGNVESLLVFNTSNSGDLTPGYYYWLNGSWKRIGSSTDSDITLPDNIVIWNPQGEAFYYLDENGEETSINLGDIVNESITTLVDNVDGTYTYTSENNTVTTINVPADVVGDISNNGIIYEEIIGLLDGRSSSFIDNGDGTFTHISGDGNEVTFDANTTNFSEDENGSYFFVNANGDRITINPVADVVENITNQGSVYNEIISLIDENGGNVYYDGDEFTYVDESGSSQVININDLFDETITTLSSPSSGVYVYTNESGSEVTINVTQDVISNFEEIITNETVINEITDVVVTNIQNEGAIYDEILEILGTETDVLVDNTDGTYTHTAVDGTEVIIDANTTSVSEADGVYTFTDGDDNIITTIDTNADAIAFDNSTNGFSSDNVQSALEEIQDNLDSTTDTLVDNNDGTYTHTAVDGTEVTIDANTTSVVENADGSYTFTDGDDNEITTVETAASTNQYDNTDSGLTSDNVQDALDEILESLEDGNSTIDLVDNADGTVTLVKPDGSEVSVDKSDITDEGDGTYTFTNNDGTDVTIDTNADTSVYDNTDSGLTSDNVQDALDEIQDNLDSTTDTLVNNNDGTYTHTAVDGTEVTIDANTTSVSEADGVYTFTDGNGDTITTIDTNADALNYDNTDSGLASDNVQDALDEIQGNLEGASDGAIISNDLTVTGGENSTFKDVTLEIAPGAVGTGELANEAVTNDKLADNAVSTSKVQDGTITSAKIQNGEVNEVDINTDAVSTDKIQNGAVTAEKLGSDGVSEGQVPIADGNGNVIYGNVSADNVEGEDLTAGDGSITVVDGTGATLVDANVRVATDGITNDKLADNAVTTENIIDGAVETDDLAADAVTNDKLADDAVNTENILNGAVGTDDLADQSVTSEKLVADPADENKVGVVQADGSIVYENISSESVDGKDFTSNDLTITNGAGATLTAVTAEIADGAVDTDALGADAVTNDKLADDAVNTENIVDGGVGTSDLAGNSVTADKLNSGGAASGQVGIADGSGNVTYGNISSENVDGADLTAGDGSITVVDGTGATLVDANVSVATDGITNDKLADNAVDTENIMDGAVGTDDLADDAVTNDKLGDNAVNTENIVDGAVEASDINSNVAGDGLTQNSTGALEVNANNGVTATTDNIQLGGDLIQPTAITTDATNTLAVEGLQDGSTTDNIVVADPNTGELKQLKAAMPKFFYMPSVVFDTSTQGTGFTRNLHQDYVDQFGSPVVSSSGASGAIPTLGANDLEYYITYYDDTVFENVSIDALGNLTYDVISSTNSAASFMNIVFVVK